MGYCFMKFEKANTIQHIGNIQKHNLREKEVANADKSLEHLNDEMVSLNGKSLADTWKERMNELECYRTRKIRNDAVKVLEVVTTFSREDRDHIDIEKWKADNKKWLEKTFNADKEKYGNNILSMVFHADEPGNVHIHTVVIPIDDKGHLNASYYVGSPTKVTELQNSYGKAMNELHGLERGIKGSRASHQDLARFYTQINKAVNPEIPKWEPEDTVESYQKKVEEKLQSLGLKIVELENGKNKQQADLITRIKELEAAIEKRDKEIADSIKEQEKQEKEKEEFEREYGTISAVKEKLKTVDAISFAIKYHEDEAYACQIRDGMNELARWGKKKKKQIDERGKTVFEK